MDYWRLGASGDAQDLHQERLAAYSQDQPFTCLLEYQADACDSMFGGQHDQ